MSETSQNVGRDNERICPTSTADITRLIGRSVEGDTEARNELIERIYDELKQMAVRQFFRERNDHTLQATALVHEAYIRIFKEGGPEVVSRAYLFGAVAEAMRRILIEHARKRTRRENAQLEPWDTVIEAIEHTHKVDYCDLHQALDELRRMSERQCEVVCLRFFSDLKFHEIADYLGVSVSTTEKDWQAARAWLHRRLQS